jgi:hypothetical protein
MRNIVATKSQRGQKVLIKDEHGKRVGKGRIARLSEEEGRNEIEKCDFDEDTFKSFKNHSKKKVEGVC